MEIAKFKSPIQIAQEIIKLSLPVIDKYHLSQFDHTLDYVGIFPKTEDEFEALHNELRTLGKPVFETSTGTTYKLDTPIDTVKGKLELLRVRIYSRERTDFRGHPDYAVSDFDHAKKKLLQYDTVNLIVRPEYEMIEIWDEEFDVLVYIPSIPLSRDI